MRNPKRGLKRTLVLGGAGFLGSQLLDVLLRERSSVISIDRAEPSFRQPGVLQIRGDIASVDLPSVIGEHEIDTVFHAAGTGFVPDAITDPAADLASNTLTTLAILEALRRCD